MRGVAWRPRIPCGSYPLVAADRQRARRQAGDQARGRVAFARAGGRDHTRVDDEVVSVLREHFAEIRELGFGRARLLKEATVEIGGGLMRRIGPPLAVEIDRGIAGILRRCAGSITTCEIFLSGPRLEQGAARARLNR
jgi:hypothetical protein